MKKPVRYLATLPNIGQALDLIRNTAATERPFPSMNIPILPHTLSSYALYGIEENILLCFALCSGKISSQLSSKQTSTDQTVSVNAVQFLITDLFRMISELASIFNHASAVLLQFFFTDGNLSMSQLLQ